LFVVGVEVAAAALVAELQESVSATVLAADTGCEPAAQRRVLVVEVAEALVERMALDLLLGESDDLFGRDRPSAMIGKLGCAGFIPNSSRTFDDSEFCNPLDRQIAHAESLGLTNHRKATLAWRRLDRELTDGAIWLPTITTKQTDLISSRVGNYQYNPFWGAIIDQLWVR
jgi:hypothetical protein